MTYAKVAVALTIIGLIATVLGALKAARAVILTDDQAVVIGTTRLASKDDEVNRGLPLVRALREQSRAARAGLLWVAGGSFLQIVAAILGLL